MFRKFWKKGALLLFSCFMMSAMGCQCLVVLPPVEFRKPKKEDLTKRVETEKKKPPRECDLAIEPTGIKFASTAKGQTRQKTVRVTNVGERTCVISGIRVVGLSPKGNKAFSATHGETLPRILVEKESFQIDVSFRALAMNSVYKGVLLVDNNSPFRPQLRVSLEGRSDGPCLKLSPPKLSLGSTQRGCSSRLQYATLSLLNKSYCPSSIRITEARLLAGTSSEFRLDETLQFPITIQRGKSGRVGVLYSAKDLGTDQGTLEINTDFDKQSFRVALEGKGVPDATQVDTFFQKERSVVDILFVVDSSASMQDNQNALGNNFNSFIRWAIRLQADYHIGVTTTDVTGRRYPAGCLRGVTTTVITPKTNNPVAAFNQNVRVGTAGSAREMGLEGSYQALLPKAQKGCNKGFYRKEALLSLIYVSDEPDQSPRSVNFYINFFRSLKGSAATSLLRASAIVGPERTGCSSASGTAGPGTGYLKVSRVLGGVTASICSSNWSNTLSRLGIASFGRQSQFRLTRPALPSSIVVRVSGKVIPRDSAKTWFFDEKKNTVFFVKTYIPNFGSVVKISYQVACLP